MWMLRCAAALVVLSSIDLPRAIGGPGRDACPRGDAQREPRWNRAEDPDPLDGVRVSRLSGDGCFIWRLQPLTCWKSFINTRAKTIPSLTLLY